MLKCSYQMYSFIDVNPKFCQTPPNKKKTAAEPARDPSELRHTLPHRVIRFIFPSCVGGKDEGDGLSLVLNPPSLDRHRGVQRWRGV